MEGAIDIAVLASGSGTNLQALIDTPDLGAKIRLVVSDKPKANALSRASGAGIETRVIEWGDYESRESFSNAVVDAIVDSGSEMVVLAGFMRILSAEAVSRFKDRTLNIHPSLLPAFPGTDAVAQAIKHGVKVSGVTVHVVDEKVDHGPIIAQRAVPVLPGDDEASLHARIQVEEHDLLSKVVRAFAAGEIEIQGREVIWR